MSTIQDSLYDITRVNVDISNENILNVRKLKFHKGAIYGVVGPAGSGKTTMLKLLSGLIKESSGEVKYDNSFFETNWMGKAILNPEIKFVDFKLFIDVWLLFLSTFSFFLIIPLFLLLFSKFQISTVSFEKDVEIIKK